MKILTVGYLHGSGGAERQIILLSNQLAKLGHDITLCVLCENSSPYEIDEKVHIIDLSEDEGIGKLRIWKRFRLFKKTVNNIRPNVIVNYNLQSAYFCLAIPKRIRGKVVYSERGDPYDAEYNGLLGVIRNLTIKGMDGIVFQSEGARDFFDEYIKQKSVIIHNSVNVPQEKYQLQRVREKRIVNVGRLHPQKNHQLLIEAFAKIASEFPEYALEIYGDGVLRDKLLKQIDNLALSGRVHLHASCKDVWQRIYTASLFVLTSDYEGMPNALMEAMALGLPCIATDCRPGGARTLIEDGGNGFIVPLRNSEVLAIKMRYVLAHPTERERIAKEARHIQDTHNDIAIFSKWDMFLRHLQSQ